MGVGEVRAVHDDRLKDLLIEPREKRNVEFKAALAWESPETKDKITRSVLAMSNILYGGAIVIGVGQKGQSFSRSGMTEEQAGTFSDDILSAYVNKYADPSAQFTVTPMSYEGKLFVVVEVDEFREIPVVCKRDGTRWLRRGALYTRSRGKVESCEISTHEDMRELLEIATEKQFRNLLTRLQRAGIGIIETAATLKEKRSESTRRKFDEQIDRL